MSFKTVLVSFAATAFTLLSIDANAATEKVLWSFGNGSDGQLPVAGLISVDGTLYGTTALGGQNGQNIGTVFSLDPKTGSEKVLWSFGNGTDGQSPIASLISVKGTLYGTTKYGGQYNCDDGRYTCGTVFSLDPNTGSEKVLWSFGNGTDGQYPFASLMSVKGTLYATTAGGGQYGSFGTVFSLGAKNGKEKVLYSFCPQQNCTEGGTPGASLISLNGTLYSTTLGGGQNSGGTVFSFDPGNGEETALYSFCSQPNCTDGNGPSASLISVNGTLYGTTTDGGTNSSCGGGSGSGCGTVFSLDPHTGSEKVLWSFGNGSDGQLPVASLISAKGTLYGTTEYGGQYGRGTVFSLDPKKGSEKVLWSFGNGSDGQLPVASLISVNGTLYGTTRNGGQYGGQNNNCNLSGCGTVFSLKP
jgi:uncharacterized repeat protein (TIGR03803 family)